jgi:fructose-specific phosphotransferase system IIA component
MKFTDFLTQECCVMTLESTTKEGAIRELSAVLARQGKLTDTDDFIKHILERERLGSTGIGNYVAVPHCPTRSVKQLVMAFGRSPAGIEFGAQDGNGVKYVFLMGANPDHLNVYLKMLAGLSRLLTNREFRDKFGQAQTAEQLIGIFRAYEK